MPMCSFRLREKLTSGVAGQLFFHEPLSRHTSWKVGGPAEILFYPESIEALKLAVLMAREEKVPVTLLGNGTNVLVSDKGLEGLTVKLRNLRQLEVQGNCIIAEPGVSLPELSRVAQQHNLSGLEFAVGIPASVGGAVAGNAGAHGSSMKDIVVSVLAMDYEGLSHLFGVEELGFGYRSSLFKDRQFIVLEARMALATLPGEEIKKKMEHYLDLRRQSQPVGLATAGSVFVNPASAPAGYLIERAGLKGAREGGAQVSTKHANFIVNIDRATADDIMRLIRRIQESVFSKFKVRLETEIKFLGELP